MLDESALLIDTLLMALATSSTTTAFTNVATRQQFCLPVSSRQVPPKWRWTAAWLLDRNDEELGSSHMHAKWLACTQTPSKLDCGKMITVYLMHETAVTDMHYAISKLLIELCDLHEKDVVSPASAISPYALSEEHAHRTACTTAALLS
jgi:hypothetical protein